MRILSITALSLMAACRGCTSVEDHTPTWHQDVAPILGQNCVNCHNPAGIGAFVDLGDYDDTTAWADRIRTKVATAEMPPFLAADTQECPNEWGFVNDLRLSEADIATITAWVDGGTPLGDPQNAAPISVPQIPQIARVDQGLVPLTPYTTQPSAVIQDELVCFVLDPMLSGTRYLEAVESVPDNVSVTHHMVINLASRDEANALDAADGTVDGTYECFSGTGASGPLIGGWVPGTGPTVYPNGSALTVTDNDVFIVQMHYHNIETAQTDASSLLLQYTDTPPEKPIYMELLGNANSAAAGLQPGPNDAGDPTFFIPAGATNHTETSRHALPIPAGRDYSVFMVVPHMHYIGVSLRAWIETEDGSPGPCLVHTPRWDFDWQLFYYYDAETDNAPVVRGGDTLVIECTYDNTVDNPGVQRVMSELGLTDPQDVLLGDGSLFEMCILAVGAIPR